MAACGVISAVGKMEFCWRYLSGKPNRGDETARNWFRQLVNVEVFPEGHRRVPYRFHKQQQRMQTTRSKSLLFARLAYDLPKRRWLFLGLHLCKNLMLNRIRIFANVSILPNMAERIQVPHVTSKYTRFRCTLWSESKCFCLEELPQRCTRSQEGL
jgi:hypothetical protein